MRISDWSSYVCSSDLLDFGRTGRNTGNDAALVVHLEIGRGARKRLGQELDHEFAHRTLGHDGGIARRTGLGADCKAIDAALDDGIVRRARRLAPRRAARRLATDVFAAEIARILEPPNRPVERGAGPREARDAPKLGRAPGRERGGA